MMIVIANLHMYTVRKLTMTPNCICH